MSSKKLAYVLVPPTHGHVNPITALAYELVQSGNTRVIFYGTEEFRDIIEKTGAEYRPLAADKFFDTPTKEIDIRTFYQILKETIDFSYKILPNLIADVDRERPDILVYDQFFYPVKCLLKILKKPKYTSESYKPKSVAFYPSFAMNRQIASKNTSKLFKNVLLSIYLMFLIFLKQQVFNLYHGIFMIHPLITFMVKDENLNIVAVFPELQPKREMFDQSFKFVGPCIVEKVRNFQITDARLKNVIDTFPVRDLDETAPNDEPAKLVYVSMGTLYNENVKLFENIIDSFRLLDNDGAKIKLTQLKVVISVGDNVFKRFENKVKYENYKIPENVMLFPRVPQVEILKRASLFLTHAGQNSTSETIQYAVPMICLPIFGDQPMVADRVCRDLNLGIQFDPTSFKPSELADAIQEMLTNPVYKERINELSKVSRKYDGVKTSRSLLMSLLNENKKSD